MFHPGYIESCHEKKDAKWYRGELCPEWYCKRVEEGSFIPCGTSGDNPFCIVHRNIIIPLSWLHLEPFNVHCCGFVFGKDCTDKKLLRRWSCCNASYEGTFRDMINLKGCSEKYNKTV